MLPLPGWPCTFIVSMNSRCSPSFHCSNDRPSCRLLRANHAPLPSLEPSLYTLTSCGFSRGFTLTSFHSFCSFCDWAMAAGVRARGLGLCAAVAGTALSTAGSVWARARPVDAWCWEASSWDGCVEGIESTTVCASEKMSSRYSGSVSWGTSSQSIGPSDVKGSWGLAIVLGLCKDEDVDDREDREEKG